MKVTIYGSGYVGLVTGTCLAEVGNDVLCVDVDKNKIDGLNNGKIPIYEPGLEPMVTRNDEAFKLDVDHYLLHDREIINRTDDSVILPYKDRRLFLRKSRGYVPDPMPIPHGGSVFCVGAERNSASSFSRV